MVTYILQRNNGTKNVSLSSLWCIDGYNWEGTEFLPRKWKKRDMNELKAMILNERKIIIIKNNINKKWLATNG